MGPVHTLEVPGMKLEVFEEKVRISPVGFLGFFSKGTTGAKDIPFSSITAVEFREAGVMTGYIQFSIHGGKEYTGGLAGAYADENTVTFGGAMGGGTKYNSKAAEIKDYIDAKMAQRSRLTTNDLSSAPLSIADEIGKLSALRSQGVISDQEFDTAKSRLLG